MRDKRLTEKRKRIVTYKLIGKTGILLCVIPFIPSFLLGSTLASFNDVDEGVLLTSTEWIVATEEEVEHPEKGKRASLSFDGLQVWQDCSFIVGEVKNVGNNMNVPWEIEVYKKDGKNWVRMPDTNIFVSNLKNGEIAQFSHEPKSAGTYKFRFVREASHPGGQNGGWSSQVDYLVLDTCAEKAESVEEEAPEQKQEEQVEESKPKAEEPKPKAEEPKVEETKSEKPKAEEPKEQPKVEETPVIEEPVIEAPANENTSTSEVEEVEVTTSDASSEEANDQDEE
ncbi:hypothetical protein FLK61_29680 [Paenalkalicoccus suaedae]|uniref:Amyloid fiber anchoring/assembly protein TapA n=1 Tax=Paenalkalicoccus suaedae TaxID=2592382 RepID=A0A859FCC7_9BACI|nr:hypothetical protein [Paenalkalicoccus suaedae]QKS70899.1 hypothetical protein FLK61_29680 [Paenalkalicoccus suaedae]